MKNTFKESKVTTVEDRFRIALLERQLEEHQQMKQDDEFPEGRKSLLKHIRKTFKLENVASEQFLDKKLEEEKILAAEQEEREKNSVFGKRLQAGRERQARLLREEREEVLARLDALKKDGAEEEHILALEDQLAALDERVDQFS